MLEDPTDYYRRDEQGVFWCNNCPLKTPHKRDLLRKEALPAR